MECSLEMMEVVEYGGVHCQSMLAWQRDSPIQPWGLGPISVACETLSSYFCVSGSSPSFGTLRCFWFGGTRGSGHSLLLALHLGIIIDEAQGSPVIC